MPNPMLNFPLAAPFDTEFPTLPSFQTILVPSLARVLSPWAYADHIPQVFRFLSDINFPVIFSRDT